MNDRAKMICCGFVFLCLRAVASVTAGRTPTNRPESVEIKILRAGLSYESPFNHLSTPQSPIVIPNEPQNLLSR